MVRAAVKAAPACTRRGVDIEPELGGNRDLSPERCQRFADKFLVDERAVSNSVMPRSTAARIRPIIAARSAGGP
jgi:hypothetical protein